MGRIVLIGIDGLDWRVLEPRLAELPAIRRIASEGWAGLLPSIFPPDSIPAWISIFTGLDPSEHGILETIDYFKKDARAFAVDTAAFRGKTFWDAAGEAGRRVLVVNPLLAYPPWPVKGIMASGPVFISGDSRVEPPEVGLRIDLPPLGGIVDFPSKGELDSFAAKSRSETEAIVRCTLALMESEPWDLAFVTLLTMDRMFHFFWRYEDPDDPTHPRRSRHAGVIRDFHRYLDGCVERIRRAAGDDAVIMIVSDHGHGRRAPRFYHVNELLRRNGLLESRIAGPPILSPRYHADRLKDAVLETLHRLDLEDVSYRVARIFPWTRRMKKGSFMTEPLRNLATASEFGGSNPFGGVDISRERCERDGVSYEELRDRVIALLREARDPEGKSVFLWAKRREELFGGPRIDRYPDILYEMIPEYGTGWSIHRSLVTLNPRHRKISGGHRSSGVLVAGPLREWRVNESRVSLLNVAATVLAVLADGRSPQAGADSPAGAAAAVPGESFLERR